MQMSIGKYMLIAYDVSIITTASENVSRQYPESIAVAPIKAFCWADFSKCSYSIGRYLFIRFV